MTLDEAIRAIDDNGYVVNIGQLSNNLVKALRRGVKLGILVEFEYYGFPNPKRAWCRPENWFCKGGSHVQS